MFICYFNSLGNDFVSDDILAIPKNPEIGTLKYTFGVIMALPQRIIHFLAFHLGGITPGYFRFFNILFHLGSVFLLFTILRIVTSKNIALFTSLLFAVHPILTEGITWISSMAYILYSFFFLLSFLFYILADKDKKLYFYSLAFFVLSLISSEKAAVLFLVFILYELSFGRLKTKIKKIIPFALACFLLGLFWVGKIGTRVSSVQAETYQANQEQGLLNPFFQVPIAIGNYLKLIIWPSDLSLYQTEMTFTTLQYLVFLFFFLVFLSFIFYGWKNNKLIFFGLSFFLISLAPTLTPFRISWLVAERYVYLGSIGVFITLAFLIDQLIIWAREKDEKYKLAAYSFLAVLIVAFSIRTIIRNIDWKNEDNLWIATAKTSPSGYNIHNNLGDVYSRQGDKPRAIEEFKKAIEINPRYADAYHNLGNVYKEEKRLDEAIDSYSKALAINPRLWQSYQNLAAIYVEKNDYPKALENIKKALELNPTDQNLQSNLKMIEERMK